MTPAQRARLVADLLEQHPEEALHVAGPCVGQCGRLLVDDRTAWYALPKPSRWRLVLRGIVCHNAHQMCNRCYYREYRLNPERMPRRGGPAWRAELVDEYELIRRDLPDRSKSARLEAAGRRLGVSRPTLVRALAEFGMAA